MIPLSRIDIFLNRIDTFIDRFFDALAERIGARRRVKRIISLLVVTGGVR